MLAFWIPNPMKAALKIVEIDIARGIGMDTVAERLMALLVFGCAEIVKRPVCLDVADKGKAIFA